MVHLDTLSSSGYRELEVFLLLPGFVPKKWEQMKKG